MAEKAADFLKKYDTILFDLDGVITSEEMYWRAAALTVYEFLFSKKYYGAKQIVPSELEKNADKLKDKIFSNGKTIKYIKSKGLNNNWDLAYIVIAISVNLETEDDFDSVYEHIKGLNMEADELFEHAAECLSEDLCMPKDHVKRHGAFWTDVQHSFQEWVLGSRLFEKEWHVSATEKDKSGLIYLEKPIVDREKLVKMLEELSKNYTLGIGTGRPKTEALNALLGFDILKYFDTSRFVHHDYITAKELEKEEDGKKICLKKPHPFIFLKGVFGDDVSDDDLLLGNYDRQRCKKTLVVGDALCDLLSAKAAECDFAAVMTGIDGKAAKDMMEKGGASYVLDDVLGLLQS